MVKNKNQQIAVVGMSCIFPESLHNQDFWKNIINGKDFITDIPESHWLIDDYYDPDPKKIGKTYCKRGSFLTDVLFDPVEFGMPPNVVYATDTVQLLSLIAAKNVLQDTVSFQNKKVDKKNTSIILGVAAGTEQIGDMSAKIQKPVWVKSLRESGLAESKVEEICDRLVNSYPDWDENVFPGLLSNVVAGRIANRLDLGGTNCVVDAACASSLSAVNLGIKELQLGDTDMVISGGCDAINNIFMFMCFSKTPALSLTGDCRPFSDKADGTILGEGISMLALRRLEDAERDGDKIYAVINSVGTSSDGSSKSVYAPSPKGQALAIKRAYDKVNYTEDDVELIEAHGTGTMAGDAAEFEGLKLAFEDTLRKQFCALGSIKSQIGHTKSSAGSAGLFKAVMALNHKILPPTIKIEKPNPKMDIENTPFYLNTEVRPWIHERGSTRKASVSSFGFGGSNFHVTLEEYKGKNNKAQKYYKTGNELVLIGAKNIDEMEKSIKELLSNLENEKIENIARNSQENFDSNLNIKLALIIKNKDKAKILCENTLKKIKENPKENFSMQNQVHYVGDGEKGKLAFIFAGQGSQYLNMGSSLAMQYSESRRVWDDTVIVEFDGEKKLHEIVYPKPVFKEEDREAQLKELTKTEWAQPAIGAVSLSQLVLLRKLGIKAEAVAGHSYGEIVALYAGGVIQTEEDMLRISRRRGELMAQASKEEGAMIAVFMSAEEVENNLKLWNSKVTVANINSPKQTVVAGKLKDIEETEEKFKEIDIKFKRLPVPTAFHSSLVSPSAEACYEYIKGFKFNEPKMTIYSNTTGNKYSDKIEEIKKTLAWQLANPVLFKREIDGMYKEGVRIFLEIGPSNILSRLVKESLEDKEHISVAIDGGKKQEGLTSFWNALGVLAVNGIDIKFNKIWEEFAYAENEINESKLSKAAVRIKGCNYGKPYPPKDGKLGIPKPNPEQEEKEQIKERIDKQKESISMRDYDKQESQQSITVDNSEWLKALYDIRKDTLEAQKAFQYTLADSHKALLKIGEETIKALSKMAGKKYPVGQYLSEDIETELRDTIKQEKEELRHTVSRVFESVKQEENIPPEKDNVSISVSRKEEQATGPAKDFKGILLKIVSEKTGYPEDMLELDMDLESGLGIDSIKRVEILSALQEDMPELKEVDTIKLTALNTLGEILDFAKETSGTSQVSTPQKEEQTIGPVKDFKGILLKIVSEKTGYPEDMLELDMDLESGLGIDSIKRVEILSALQEDMPELKEVDTIKLTALNTLGEILDFAKETSGTSQVSTPQKEEQTIGPVKDFNGILLKIVSEKTGYPEDMLELDMDLESGLGIDSIKRVEILSALQEDMPELKEVDTIKLTALNTLGEILEFAQNIKSGGTQISLNTEKKEEIVKTKNEIFRYVVEEYEAPSCGTAISGLRELETIEIVKDNKGVSNILAKKLKKINIASRIVEDVTEESNAVICLKGINDFEEKEDIKEAIVLNKEAFNIAKKCGKTLFENKGLFVTVQDITRDNREWLGGINALTKTAGLEWEKTEVKSINIEIKENNNEKIAELIFNELVFGGPEQEVILKEDGKRLIYRIKVAKIDSKSRELKEGDVLIVTGGARGVTSECLNALADRVKLKIAIFGRTKLEAEEEYLSNNKTDAELKKVIVEHNKSLGENITPIELSRQVNKILSGREVRANIRKLEEKGTTVKYYSVDVCDEKKVDKVVKKVREGMGNIKGIVHAAGVLHDKYIHEKTEEQFDKVFNTKVEGLKNLLKATEKDELTHICCFSSVAARLGNKGQVDYSMANEVLNKVCQKENKDRKEKCVVKSINWGPWAGGMVSPELRKHFETQGVALIPLEEGAKIFADELEDASNENVETVVGGKLENWGKEKKEKKWDVLINKESFPFLVSHSIKSIPVVPAMMAHELCLRLANRLFPDKEIVASNKFKVLKGIQVEEFGEAGLWISITCNERVEDDEIFLDFLIKSIQGINHYSLTIELKDKNERDLPKASFNKENLDVWGWDKEKIYNEKLFHGKDFHVIDNLSGVSDEEYLGVLKYGKSLDGRDDVWGSDVAILDGGLQLTGLWSIYKTGHDALPAGFDYLKFYNRSLYKTPIYCHGKLVKKSQFQSVWDVCFCNADKEVFVKIEGLIAQAGADPNLYGLKKRSIKDK